MIFEEDFEEKIKDLYEGLEELVSSWESGEYSQEEEEEVFQDIRINCPEMTVAAYVE